MPALDSFVKKSFFETIIEGAKQGFYSFFALFKIMAPVYIFVSILKRLEILGAISGYLFFIMKYLGLPGDAALAVVLGWTINIYAAIAAFAGLGLSARQVTILGVMLGISHTHFMETAVISRMNARPWVVFSLRMIVGLLMGIMLNLILPDPL